MVGLLHIAAIGLVVAGALKIRNPVPTASALSGAGIEVGRWTVSALAVVEVVTGLSVLIVGGAVPAAVLGTLYLGFAAFIALALSRRGDSARCGCFGESDAPPSTVHIVVDAAIALSAYALAATSALPLGEVLTEQPGYGIAYLVLVATGSAAFFLIIDRLPRVKAAAGHATGNIR